MMLYLVFVYLFSRLISEKVKVDTIKYVLLVISVMVNITIRKWLTIIII